VKIKELRSSKICCKMSTPEEVFQLQETSINKNKCLIYSADMCCLHFFNIQFFSLYRKMLKIVRFVFGI